MTALIFYLLFNIILYKVTVVKVFRNLFEIISVSKKIFLKKNYKQLTLKSHFDTIYKRLI